MEKKKKGEPFLDIQPTLTSPPFFVSTQATEPLLCPPPAHSASALHAFVSSTLSAQGKNRYTRAIECICAVDSRPGERQGRASKKKALLLLIAMLLCSRRKTNETMLSTASSRCQRFDQYKLPCFFLG